jgi:hypothetical protein
MPRTSIRLLATVLMLTAATPAFADWLVVPFIGTAFRGERSGLTVVTGPIKTHTVFGGSGVWLSSQIFGVEGDFSHGPEFFDGGVDAALLASSNLTTLGGGVIAALPLGLTRESLRPYVTAGVDMMHAGIQFRASVFPGDRTLTGLHLGGGAIGFLSPRTGVRFDLRHLRTLSREDTTLNSAGAARLSFWRLTFGVVIRVG